MEKFQEKSLGEDQDYHKVRGRDYDQVRDRDYHDHVPLEDTKQVVVYGSDDTWGQEVVLNRDQNRQIDRSRICKVCGKRFRSGQALGGHISIHNILGPKKMDNKFKSTKPQYSSWVNDMISCDLCNKSFPSKKALYGHMGSHCRRGSHYRSFMSSPPPHDSSTGYSEDDDLDLIKQDYDLVNFLPSWPRKDKRYWMSTTTTSTLIPNQTPNYDSNGHASKYFKFPSSKKLKLKDHFKHGSHVCKVCKKRFLTGQALGGHMRVHYNEQAAAENKVTWTGDHDDAETIKCVEALLGLVHLTPPTSQEAIPLASRRMLDLDLNKTPEGFDEG